MFTEKDIELSIKIKNDCNAYFIERTKNIFYLVDQSGFINGFIFLKLAQLENENKRLNDKIEILSGEHEVMT